jgi:hypothetical protein
MGTSDRRPYLTATSLTQALLDQCQDNLSNKLEIVAELYDVGFFNEDFYFSDRAKYVGEKYYEARVAFPTITRTLGDWLANELEFSSLDLIINNSDGRFNRYLPGGDLYTGFIGKRVTVKLGLNEIVSSYINVFSGQVTDVSGFKRDTASFTLVCRSDFERVNKAIPNQTLTTTDWPYLEDDKIGISIPIIYGDWTVSLRPEAPEIPAYVVNGLDPLVNASLDPPDPNVGDTAVKCVISSVPLKSLDTNSVCLYRGNTYYAIPGADVSIVFGSNNQIIEIAQKGFQIEGADWIFESSDQFWLKCVGVDLGAYQDNIVWQARDLLKRFGDLVDADFDTSWDIFRDKATPPENAIANIKSRVWQQDDRQALEYALSMLEQVRLEAFVTRNTVFSISSLHLDNFIAAPTFTIRNWDIIKGTFKPETDERNNFNRAKADFAYSAAKSQNNFSTPIFRNQANITQSGREISKLITYPNLYIYDDVVNQLKETLKLSAYIENITLTLTSRSFLKDLGEHVAFNINIGSVIFENNIEPVTGKIRSLSYEPKGMTIEAKIWCYQMLPFPGSLKSGISGITGGSTAVITQE